MIKYYCDFCKKEVENNKDLKLIGLKMGGRIPPGGVRLVYDKLIERSVCEGCLGIIHDKIKAIIEKGKDSDVDRRVCKTCRYECLNKRAAPCCDCSVNGSWEPKAPPVEKPTNETPPIEKKKCGTCKHVMGGLLKENEFICIKCVKTPFSLWEPKTPPVEKTPHDEKCCYTCKSRQQEINQNPCLDCYTINHSQWTPLKSRVEKSCRNCERLKLCEKCSEFSLWEPVCQ